MREQASTNDRHRRLTPVLTAQRPMRDDIAPLVGLAQQKFRCFYLRSGAAPGRTKLEQRIDERSHEHVRDQAGRRSFAAVADEGVKVD